MNWKQIEAWTSLGALLLGGALLLCSIKPAHAGELFTEFGGGVKYMSSNVIDPRCLSVLMVSATTDSFVIDEQGRVKTVPCGGRNPIFVGWLIAYEFDNGVRLGAFHMSDWFDGPPFNHHPETAMNCICVTMRHTWRRR